MFSLDVRQGRLIEGRITSPVVLSEVAAFGRRLKELLGSIAGPVVICTDLRGANLFPPDVADGFVTLMKTDNPRLERSAFLVGESAIFGLQVERLIRDARNTARRTFRDTALLVNWLGEVVDPKERARLDAFIAEPGLLRA